ncbi:MAG: 5-methyltetrahydropteroyltriglutamate--homocysteine S-methyltransferase, partial [Candidatus Omnitrophica bacterium 4484_70.2]
MQTYAYGFPRLGENKEFKILIEKFWREEIEENELKKELDKLEEKRLFLYKSFIDHFPLAEFTYYDNIFDTALIFSVYRFRNLKDYYSYARGRKALKLKKFFNTNYHYLVPQFKKNAKFKLGWRKPFYYLDKFSSFSKIVFLFGPYTFFKLSEKEENEDLFFSLIEAYKELFKLLKSKAEVIHLEEPALALDLTSRERRMVISGYRRLLKNDIPKINLITYYESVDFLKELYKLDFSAIGLDFMSNEENLEKLKKIGFPQEKKLICGIVDGKGVRRSNILEKVKLIEKIKKYVRLKEENIIISNSCPLYHLPFSVEKEEFPESVKERLSFAKERLYELKLIKDFREGKKEEAQKWCSLKSVKRKSFCFFEVRSFSEKEFKIRKRIQQKELNLPLFPITAIGSFPQDKELRKKRNQFYNQKISKEEYENYIKEKIKNLIDFEERAGLDIFVHGEFERTDMVEYFAKNLEGFLTTKRGWIISYGTRVYRPPIIYKKIRRKEFFTKEIIFAQTLASKPVKGILTGPVTIIAWSYNITDFSFPQLAKDLATALNREAKDLVKKGIKIIQIDEPAIKEFSPLKKRKRSDYFKWTISAFNLTTQLPPHIQIHTHMCYSEFEDIISWIKKMNFDVISIEAARDKGKILDAFRKINFKRGIGP